MGPSERRGAASVRQLAEGEIEAASVTLGRAFLNEPLMVFAIPDLDTRKRLFRTYFTPGVRLALALGEVWCADDLSAVACWRRPRSGAPSAELLAAAGVPDPPETIGAGAAGRADPVYAHLAARQEQLGVPPDHWYLSMVGVAPDCQRRGLGSAVLRPVLDRARDSRVPVFLETLARRNIGFYEKNGFTAIDHGVEPSSRLAYWLFLSGTYLLRGGA
jgi:ribosomal protein S18 acetylase RimI-like enzyme